MKFIAGSPGLGKRDSGKRPQSLPHAQGFCKPSRRPFLPLIASIWNRRKIMIHMGLKQETPSRRRANEAIYERAVVKRGGADFVSRVPAHPLRRRLRSILPISDLSADELVVQPATHPLSPRPREIAPPRCRQCTKR